MYNDMSYVIDNKEIKLSIFIKISLIILLGFIVFACFYKIESFENYVAQIVERNGQYDIVLYLEISNEKFINNEKIIVDGKEYEYTIQSIDKDLIINNDDRYKIVRIKAKLDSKYLINNNYIVVKQKNASDSIIYSIIKKMKEGMNLWKKSKKKS